MASNVQYCRLSSYILTCNTLGYPRTRFHTCSCSSGDWIMLQPRVRKHCVDTSVAHRARCRWVARQHTLHESPLLTKAVRTYKHKPRYPCSDPFVASPPPPPIRYRTIMSYTCGTPRVNFFSNPDIIHLNKPTGTLMDDNARVIEDNMVRATGERQPRIPHWTYIISGRVSLFLRIQHSNQCVRWFEVQPPARIDADGNGVSSALSLARTIRYLL